MRRRLFRRVPLAAMVGGLLMLCGGFVPHRARAQGRLADQAALFLLLPVSARAVGFGHAMTAASGSGEGVWWNPAGIASVKRGDASLHHSQSVIGTSEAITVSAGTSLLGVLALSANVLDFGGEIPAVDNQGNVVGKILPRNLAVVGTYATQIGRRFRTGVSYKIVQFRFDCEGLCPSIPTKQASTTALDLGVQFDLPTKVPVSIGASLRNLGVRLQINDSPQSDPLPTRLQIGALAHYRIPKAYANDAEVRFALDVIDELPVGRPLPRMGGEFVWEKRAFLRAGYVFESDDAESGGPTLGLGFVAGRLVIDFARVFTGLSADAGQAPTYISLRVGF